MMLLKKLVYLYAKNIKISPKNDTFPKVIQLKINDVVISKGYKTYNSPKELNDGLIKAIEYLFINNP